MEKKLTIKQITEVDHLKYLKGFRIDYVNREGADKTWELVSRQGIDRLKDEITNGKRYSDGAMIFATNREKTLVVMLREYRVSAGRYIYMLPAGLADGDESVAVTSVREFKEETGMDFEFVVSDAPRYSSVGIINECVEISYGYYSGEASNRHQSPDEDAEIIFVDRHMAKHILEHEDIAIRSALLLKHFFNLNSFFERE